MQNREKQIEEMARIIANANGNEQDAAYYIPDATDLYNAGYRKSADVAEEIFAEMKEEIVRYLMLNENIAVKCKKENGECNEEYWKGKLSAFKQIHGFIDTDLKKKYTENKGE